MTAVNEPLSPAEIPEPVPGPGEVVLDVMAAGLCHSDVSAMTDPTYLSAIPKLPVVMGHEIAGVVSSLGDGVSDVRVGDRVGVWPLGATGSPGYQP